MNEIKYFVTTMITATVIIMVVVVSCNLFVYWAALQEVENLREKIPPPLFEKQVDDHEARIRGLEAISLLPSLTDMQDRLERLEQASDDGP